MPSTQAVAEAAVNGTILTMLIVAIIIVVQIIVLRFLAIIVTNAVIDTLEKRGYGKNNYWKR